MYSYKQITFIKNKNKTTNLEGDGSSWPNRDIMLIKVLIPSRKGTELLAE